MAVGTVLREHLVNYKLDINFGSPYYQVKRGSSSFLSFGESVYNGRFLKFLLF